MHTTEQILAEIERQRTLFIEQQNAKLHAARLERAHRLDELDARWAQRLDMDQAQIRDPIHSMTRKKINIDCYNRNQKAYQTERAALLDMWLRNPIPDNAESPPLDLHLLTNALSLIDAEILKYRETLSIKRRQSEFIGDYGILENEKWIAEISRFVKKNPVVADATQRLEALCKDTGAQMDWQSIAMQRVNQAISPADHLPDVASSDGVGFEHACLAILIQGGWEAQLTPTTGDQGVDIIARKGEKSVAIQCKNTRAATGNAAVQEVHAGRAFYEATSAVVVSQSGYTPSAIQLAK